MSRRSNGGRGGSGRHDKAPGESSLEETVGAITEEDLARHIPSIRRYMARILRRDELEDGVQSVLTRALENLDKFRGESSPRVWLLGITRNVGYEIARSRQRQPRLVDEDSASTGDLVENVPTQEEMLQDKQLHALTITALDEMPLDDKLALLVTYVDGLQGPEAAKVLGVSFAAFRQRLSRARTALATKMEKLTKSGTPPSESVMAQWDTWQKLLNPEIPDDRRGIASGKLDDEG